MNRSKISAEDPAKCELAHTLVDKDERFYAGSNGRVTMRCSKSHPGRMVWSFLLAVAAVCLASGAAVATCNPSLPISAGDVPCYIVVQPIDVCLSNGAGCAPFNTTPGDTQSGHRRHADERD